MTQKELSDMEMTGLITRSDAIKAIRVYPVLEMLLKMDMIDINNPPQGQRLTDLIDPFIQPLIDAVDNANAVQSGLMIEDEEQEEGTQQEDN